MHTYLGRLIRVAAFVLMVISPAELGARMPARGIEASLVDSWFEEEVWRPAGPNQSETVEFYRRALLAGDLKVVEATELRLLDLVDRGALDPSLLESSFPAIREVWAKARNGRGEAIVEAFTFAVRRLQLGRTGRAKLYDELLGTRGENAVYGLDWLGAARLALLEHMDGLLGSIESAVVAPGLRPEQTSVVGFLTNVLVPLARARRGDWEANYLALVADQVQSQKVRPDPDPRSRANLLAREALLELVRSQHRAIASQVIGMWSDLTGTHSLASGAARPGAPLPGAGGSPSGSGPLADGLVRCVRGLGDREFQQDSWKSEGRTSGEIAERTLVQRGLLVRRLKDHG